MRDADVPLEPIPVEGEVAEMAFILTNGLSFRQRSRGPRLGGHTCYVFLSWHMDLEWFGGSCISRSRTEWSTLDTGGEKGHTWPSCTSDLRILELRPSCQWPCIAVVYLGTGATLQLPVTSRPCVAKTLSELTDVASMINLASFLLRFSEYPRFSSWGIRMVRALVSWFKSIAVSQRAQDRTQREATEKEDGDTKGALTKIEEELCSCRWTSFWWLDLTSSGHEEPAPLVHPQDRFRARVAKHFLLVTLMSLNAGCGPVMQKYQEPSEHVVPSLNSVVLSEKPVAERSTLVVTFALTGSQNIRNW